MLQLHVQIKALRQSEEIKNKKFLCGFKVAHIHPVLALFPNATKTRFRLNCLTAGHTRPSACVSLPHPPRERKPKPQTTRVVGKDARPLLASPGFASPPAPHSVSSSSLWPENKTTPGTSGAPTAAPAQRRTIAKRARRFQR